MRKKRVRLSACLLIGVLLLAGCQKGPSKKEVISSEYYQKLLTANKEQKKKIESLEDEVNQVSKALIKEQQKKENETSEKKGNKKAEQYFKKMKNSSLIRIEIGYTDQYCDSVYISDPAVYPLAKKMASTADLTTKYTPEEVRKKMGPGYIYTLYEEDNSIFQAEIYAGGYVIFQDLPGQVYYCPDSYLLGQAYLVRRGSYPNSKLFHRMADSAIVLEAGKKAWTQEVCLSVANGIDEMEKEKIVKDKKKEGNSKAEYYFYSYGNRMILTLYKTQICITGWDDSETWYQMTKEQVASIKKVFN